MLGEMFGDLWCLLIGLLASFVSSAIDFCLSLIFFKFFAKDIELGVTYELRILIFSCSTLRRNFANL